MFSLWDTYRALHPLLAWIELNRTRDMVRTMLRMYREGQLPVWELAANYTGCMTGYHSVPVIVDAEQWRIDGWDHDLALEAMVRGRFDAFGVGCLRRIGVHPSDHEHESVSKTLNTPLTTRMHLSICKVPWPSRAGAAFWPACLFDGKTWSIRVRVHPGQKTSGRGRRV